MIDVIYNKNKEHKKFKQLFQVELLPMMKETMTKQTKVLEEITTVSVLVTENLSIIKIRTGVSMYAYSHDTDTLFALSLIHTNIWIVACTLTSGMTSYLYQVGTQVYRLSIN